MKNPLKKYIVLFSVCLLSLPGVSCWYGTEFEDVRYIILNPTLIQNKAWWTYFYTSKYNYIDSYSPGNADEVAIATEWKKKFNLRTSVSDIETYLFYSGDTLPDNPFGKEIQNKPVLKTYFEFAKECETILYRVDSWGDMNYDSVGLENSNLLARGVQYIDKQTGSFWKKKYAFQTLRLAFYKGDYSTFNTLYDTYFPLGKEKEPVDWWATHYKSMVLEKTDKDSANYLHALVFSHSSNKMRVSKNWFSSKNFDRLKRLAKNNEELSDLYVLKAVINPGKALEDIKEVLRLNRNHTLLSLLLIREMNKLEDWVGTHKYSDYYGEWKNHYITGMQVKALANDYYYLRAFYKLYQGIEPPSENTDLFHLIGANLAIMNQDIAGAKRYMSLVKSTDEQIVFQKKTLEIMLLVLTENVADRSTADELGKRLQYLLRNKELSPESKKITFSVMKFLAYHFREKGMNHLTGLLNYIADDKFCGSCKFGSLEYNIVDYFQYNGKPTDVEKVIALFDKTDKTELEKFLLIPYPNANYFRELLGTLYMREGNVKKARDAYAALPSEFWAAFDNLEYLDEDPFTNSKQLGVTIWKTYPNKLQITEKLLKLEEGAPTNPKNLITLGHAWFNFSDAGNAWFMLDYEWSHGSSNHSEYISDLARKKSLSYYLAAYSQLKNPEEQAEIAFGIASVYLYSSPTEDNYGHWANEYEKYKGTEFYYKANCSVTEYLQDKTDRKAFFDRRKKGYYY